MQHGSCLWACCLVGGGGGGQGPRWARGRGPEVQLARNSASYVHQVQRVCWGLEVALMVVRDHLCRATRCGWEAQVPSDQLLLLLLFLFLFLFCGGGG